MIVVLIPATTLAVTLIYLSAVLAGGTKDPLTAGYLTVTIPLISLGLYVYGKRGD